MATGEYVSVSSQSDTENAALAQEKKELETDYQGRGTGADFPVYATGAGPAIARLVAEQLMKKDALDAHAREELGADSYELCAAFAGGPLFGWELFCRCGVAPHRCLARSRSAGFVLYYSFDPVITCGPGLYILGGEQSQSGQGHHQDYLLEHYGHGFVDGNRSSCRASSVLARVNSLERETVSVNR